MFGFQEFKRLGYVPNVKLIYGIKIMIPVNKLKVVPGDKYGLLTIIKEIDQANHGKEKKRRFKCICECGQIATPTLAGLRSGNSKSCGCIRKNNNKKHGMAKSSIYMIWGSMINRCKNKTSQAYHYYGGRGIQVCQRWLNFKNFFEDMGERPLGATLDRKNNNKNYSPDNCRWISHKKNCQNSSRAKYWFVNGIRYNSLSDAANKIGVDTATIFLWCNGGKKKGKIYTPKKDCWSTKKY